MAHLLQHTIIHFQICDIGGHIMSKKYKIHNNTKHLRYIRSTHFLLIGISLRRSAILSTRL